MVVSRVILINRGGKSSGCGEAACGMFNAIAICKKKEILYIEFTLRESSNKQLIPFPEKS